MVINRPSTTINPRSGSGRIIWSKNLDTRRIDAKDADKRLIDAWEKAHGSLCYGTMTMKRTRPPEPAAMLPKGLPWARTPKPKSPKTTPDELLLTLTLKDFKDLAKVQSDSNKDLFIGPTKRPMLKDILKNVAKKHGLPIRDMTLPSRHKRLIEPRRECYYEMRRQTGCSLEKIAVFMKRDHTTICHSIRMHTRKHNLPRLLGGLA